MTAVACGVGVRCQHDVLVAGRPGPSACTRGCGAQFRAHPRRGRSPACRSAVDAPSTCDRGLPRPARVTMARRRLTATEVAVLVAAHNEELVIAETIRAASRLVDTGNIFIISDGSTDATGGRRASGRRECPPAEPEPWQGGALAAGIEHFELCQRFQVVLLLDADTHLAPDYLTTGLPLFDDPEVVAVAGRARTIDDRGACVTAGTSPGRLPRTAVPDRAVAGEVRAGGQMGERGDHRPGVRQHVPHQRTRPDRRHRRRAGHRGLQHDLRDPRRTAGPHRVPSLGRDRLHAGPGHLRGVRPAGAAAGSSGSGRPSGGTASTPACSGSRWPSSSSN